MPPPLIRLQDIARTFGHIQALEDVNMTVAAGEVVALLGDNGAGKSTLVKILTGVHPPTSGQLFFAGDPIHMAAPGDARRLGIETVYQDLALVPLMSIARNFHLGRELVNRVGPFAFLDHEGMRRQTRDALAAIGIEIRDPDETVESLSGGERQSIAIGRAVHFGSKLLVLDEPTSALSIGETRKVLNYIDRARQENLGVVFVTHNIHHVFAVADRLTILAHGRKLGDFHRDAITPEEASQMIVDGTVPTHLQSAVQTN
ncbi:MAG: ATP-binding cassette domain-containing protein [Candidatus Latescibacteria bacterium]|nr:ATP-binding cassette domain-containing protein [Candidatus Latescibacterota bacterium]